ncbi:MAG: hypothetical protein HKN00_14295, partial [Flavobacteriaceae bacterium]|nr:hypothetical protein [Flavobacteriaceae bacterium]
MHSLKPHLLFFTTALFSSSFIAMADVDIPFDEAELFFELNDTDGDLG